MVKVFGKTDFGRNQFVDFAKRETYAGTFPMFYGKPVVESDGIVSAIGLYNGGIGWSYDGMKSFEATNVTGVKVRAAAFFKGRFFAYDMASPNAHVWTSEDGENWEVSYSFPSFTGYNVCALWYDETANILIVPGSQDIQFYSEGDVRKVSYSPFIWTADGVTWNKAVWKGIEKKSDDLAKQNTPPCRNISKIKTGDYDGIVLWNENNTNATVAATYVKIGGYGQYATFDFAPLCYNSSEAGHSGSAISGVPDACWCAFNLGDVPAACVNGNIGIVKVNLETKDAVSVTVPATVLRDSVTIDGTIYFAGYDGSLYKMLSTGAFSEVKSYTTEIPGVIWEAIQDAGDGKVLLFGRDASVGRQYLADAATGVGAEIVAQPPKVCVKKDYSAALAQIGQLTGADQTAAKIIEILKNA